MPISSLVAGPQQRFKLGRLEIDALTFTQALASIAQLIERKQGGFVLTPNVDHVVRATNDSLFRSAYAAAALSLADGMPVVWASHLLRQPLPEKISGSSLVVPLMELAAKRRWRVYLLGGGAGVADAAARVLQTKFPDLKVVGTDSSHLSPERHAPECIAAVARVRAAQPDLLLVALGTPKQEYWMHHHAKAMAPVVAIGVGASFDFVSGRILRAPEWVSLLGFEWLFRFLLEPRRLFRRYFIDDLQFFAILWRAFIGRSSQRSQPDFEDTP